MVKSYTMFTVSCGIMILVLDSVILHHHTGVKVRVYCQVGKANQGKFALDVAVRTLELYKE
jgi:puromycin-sensitive aminopeptidase